MKDVNECFALLRFNGDSDDIEAVSFDRIKLEILKRQKIDAIIEDGKKHGYNFSRKELEKEYNIATVKFL